MTTRNKSILIILATLCIGVLIGAMGYRAWVGFRFRKLRSFRRPAGVTRIIERRIEPTEKQKKPVRAVLRDHASRFTKMHRRHRAEIKSMLDSLKTDLYPILTPEQRRRLDRHGFRRPPHRRGAGRRRGTHDRHPGPPSIRHFERIIDPDSAQQGPVRRILEKYAPPDPHDDTVLTAARRQRTDSMIVELEPLLRPGQMEQLRKRLPPRSDPDR